MSSEEKSKILETKRNNYRHGDKTYHAARTKRYRVKLKMDVIKAYGGCCSCCEEDHPDFLTVDHVKNDGNVHRRTLKGTQNLYRMLRDAGYPKDDYTVLCFNCNIARSLFGTCPHQRT